MKSGIVGDDRVLGDRLQRQRPDALQLVAGGDDDGVIPGIVREGDDIGVLLQRLGGNADVGAAVEQHGDDLLRAGLMQHQPHLGKSLLELHDHLRQRVARLCVRRRHRQLALVAQRELLGELLDVLGVEQHPLDDADQLLAGLCQSEQPLAAAHEQLDPQLVLEILDVLADAGLRGIESVGNIGQVELAAYGFANDAKLLKVHVWAPRSKTRSLELTRRTGWPAARLSSESFCVDNSTSKN